MQKAIFSSIWEVWDKKYTADSTLEDTEEPASLLTYVSSCEVEEMISSLEKNRRLCTHVLMVERIYVV